MADPKVPEKNAADAENTAPAPAEPASSQADAAPENLAEQLAKLHAEKDDLWQTLIRHQADFENYRKRIERERHEEGQRVLGRVLEAVLPVLDAFERALAAHNDPAYADYRTGFELIYRQLWDVLARQGLERIDARGKRFDPYYHHAVERVESTEHEDGAILEVLQHGYLFRGRVLRPAGVRVAVQPAEKASGTKARERSN